MKLFNLHKSLLFWCLALIAIIGLTSLETSAQTTDSTETFSIKLEFRPRSEFRNGYRLLRSDTTQPLFFTENRLRLYLNYQRKGFIFHTSIQDIRTWGEQDPRATTGSIQVFEGYVEPTITKNFSMRIGRQKLMLDNQRLFAENDWRQNSGSHDGLRLIYKKGKLETLIFGAFNQEAGSQARFFETDYSPGFQNYKVLLVHNLVYKPTKEIALTTIHSTDAFQDADNPRVENWRNTTGGRVEYTKDQWYLTMSGYAQYGKSIQGDDLKAYYLQPEIRFTALKNWTLRLGAEVFSGDDALNPDGRSHSFDALYGVNHRFLGNMDLFIRFPGDFNNAGIIDPYLFIFYDIGKQVTLRSDQHLFYSQNNFVPSGEFEPIDKYLGFEHDILVKYRPNSFTVIDFGFSYGLWTESMEDIRKGGNHELFQTWAYCMVALKPELFSWSRKVKA